MIPKKVHYIWLSGEEMTNETKLIINDWQNILPDYLFILWDAKAYELIADKPQYIIDAYKLHKWAFVSDYVRVYALYTQGGWYMDSDMQLVRNELDKLGDKYDFVSAIECISNEYSHYTYQYKYYKFNVDTCGILILAAFMGSQAYHPFLRSVMEKYRTLNFDYLDYETLIAPVIYAQVAENYGLVYEDKEQDLKYNMHLLKSDKVLAHKIYFNYDKKNDFFAIHHCAHSWVSNPWHVDEWDYYYFKNILKERKHAILCVNFSLIKYDDREQVIKLLKQSLECLHKIGMKVTIHTDSMGSYLILTIHQLPYDTILIDLDYVKSKCYLDDKLYVLKNMQLGEVFVDYGLILRKDYPFVFLIKESYDMMLYSSLNLKTKYTWNVSKETVMYWYNDLLTKISCIGFNNEEAKKKCISYLNIIRKEINTFLLWRIAYAWIVKVNKLIFEYSTFPICTKSDSDTLAKRGYTLNTNTNTIYY